MPNCKDLFTESQPAYYQPHITLTIIAQRDFWRGICTTIAIFGTIAISCIFNVYLGKYQSVPTTGISTPTGSQVG